MAAAKKATKITKATQKPEKKGVQELLRTGYLIGLGAFSVTTDEIEKLVNRLIKEGEASEKEGKKLIEDFNKKVQKSRKDFEKWVDKQVNETLKKVRLEDQLKDLSRKVKDLTKKVEKTIKRETEKKPVKEVEIE